MEKSEGSVLNVRGCFLDCEGIPTGLFFFSRLLSRKKLGESAELMEMFLFADTSIKVEIPSSTPKSAWRGLWLKMSKSRGRLTR